MVVWATSVASKAPPPRRMRITIGPKMSRPAAAEIERNAIVARFVVKTRLKVFLSPPATADDRAGKAAVANATPQRLSGRLWKCWAKVNEVTDPGARREARPVKYRAVNARSGWLIILGPMSFKNSPRPLVLNARLGNGRKLVR